MKLYLSSIEIPTPGDLATLLGKPLKEATVALIPNAQDYYSPRAREYKITQRVKGLEKLGLKVTTLDLRDFRSSATLGAALGGHDLIWGMSGNTFCLRYEMKKSGFDDAIRELLASGMAYGGDSAGALVAGPSIAGIESADIPQFAKEVIKDGLGLIPEVVMPHADNPEFAEVMPIVRALHKDKHPMIELKDAQAVIFAAGSHRVVDSRDGA